MWFQIKKTAPTATAAEIFEKRKGDLEKEIKMEYKQTARKEAEKEFENLKVTYIPIYIACFKLFLVFEFLDFRQYP